MKMKALPPHSWRLPVLPDTSIFEYFFGSLGRSIRLHSGGKNRDGDYPIHVVCCDPLVSLQAITFLVNPTAAALAGVDGDEGLLPFHFATNWGASRDVIFYLLRHCPNALHHVENAAAAASASAVGHPSLSDVRGTSGSSTDGTATTGSDDSKRQNARGGGGLVKKIAKTAHCN